MPPRQLDMSTCTHKWPMKPIIEMRPPANTRARNPGDLLQLRCRSQPLDAEHRVIRRPRQRLEVTLDLVTPARQVGFDDARFLAVGELRCPKRFDTGEPA